MESMYKLFEQQAIANRNKSCIVANERKYSYEEFFSEIEWFTNQIEYDDQHNKYLVYMNRSYDMLVAIWFILRTGGTYIPLDLNFTDNHIEEVMISSHCNKVLVDEQSYDRIKALSLQYGMELINVSKSRKQQHFLYRSPKGEQSNKFSYIIYTSGTTGKPKGIHIPNTAFVSFLTQFYDTIFTSYDFHQILAHTSISFDISMVEIIFPFIFGKTIILCQKPLNIKGIYELINDYTIDCIQLTPTLLNLLLLYTQKTSGQFTSIKTLFVGGEKLTKDLVHEVQSVSQCRIVNVYGPTETTVWCSAQAITCADQITIGDAFGDNEFFLLDDDNKRIDDTNSSGELCIAGNQLAEGYVCLQELTRQSFVEDATIYPRRFYRTGDLAYRDDNGEYVVQGRKDRQIKLNGKRIEIEEVETAVRKLKDLEDLVVVVKKCGLDHKMYCYYVSNHEINQDEAKATLKNYLEEWKIPKVFERISKIPTTISGKLDRNSCLKIH